jgi:uncharacterized repeat protein (TIGR03803 family)
MSANSAAPIALMFASNANAVLPFARHSPVIPEPTTAATKKGGSDDTDGNLYGTTGAGGTGPCGCGTIFKIKTPGTLTTLHSFDLTDGADPNKGLIQATDGNFDGPTYYRGTNNSNCNSGSCGTIFKMTPSGTLTTHSPRESEIQIGLCPAQDTADPLTYSMLSYTNSTCRQTIASSSRWPELSEYLLRKREEWNRKHGQLVFGVVGDFPGGHCESSPHRDRIFRDITVRETMNLMSKRSLEFARPSPISTKVL